MDPLTMALIGAGAGAGKSVLFDQPAAERQNKLTAAMIKYSPWTHYQWDGKMADPSGNMGENMFAMGGSGLTYGLQNQQNDYFKQALYGKSDAAKEQT